MKIFIKNIAPLIKKVPPEANPSLGYSLEYNWVILRVDYGEVSVHSGHPSYREAKEILKRIRQNLSWETITVSEMLQMGSSWWPKVGKLIMMFPDFFK